MHHLDFNCTKCGSRIEHFDDYSPLSGCPHHNKEKRGFTQDIISKVDVRVSIQYDPHGSGGQWVASMFGVIGTGDTVQQAIKNANDKYLGRK